jgi:hypothetical protein
MLRTVATSWTGARLGRRAKKGKLMPKTPILKLIPSGKKLSEVTYNVELLGVLSASIVGVLFKRDPKAKVEVLAYLHEALSWKKLNKHQKDVTRDAIEIVNRYP